MKNAQPIVYCLYRYPGFGADQNQEWQEQQRQCRVFAQEQGWTIAKEFRGTAVSPEQKVCPGDNDPLLELKATAQRGEFDVLLVADLSCLGRQQEETPCAALFFENSGVEVWSVAGERLTLREVANLFSCCGCFVE